MTELKEKISGWFNSTPHDMGKTEFDALMGIIETYLMEKQAPVTVRLSAGLAVLRGEMRKREETARARKLHHAKEEAYLWATTDKQEELHFQHFGKKLDELKEKYS